MSLYEEWSKIGLTQRNILAEAIAEMIQAYDGATTDEMYIKNLADREYVIRDIFDCCEKAFDHPEIKRLRTTSPELAGLPEE